MGSSSFITQQEEASLHNTPEAEQSVKMADEARRNEEIPSRGGPGEAGAQSDAARMKPAKELNDIKCRL
jgi:hypothetical protein